MRAPVAITLACIAAAAMFVEALPANCSKTYKVVSNDNCSKIASKAGISVSTLASLNSQINPDCSNLNIAQSLCVGTTNKSTILQKRTTTKTATTTNKPTITAKKATTTTKKANTTTTKKNTNTTKTATTTTQMNTITTKKAATTTKLNTNTTTTTSSTTSTTTTITTTTIKNPISKTATTTAATATTTTTDLVYNYGLTAQVSSKTDFCLFLPSSPGGKADNNGVVDDEAISKSEKNAVAYCLQNSADAPGARTLPVSFIETSYFFKNTTAGYVQVTGSFNPAAWELSPNDGGGQYDNHGKGSPPNSMCYGYKYYVGLIEPDGGHYCMRCCNHYADCNAGRSTYGCKRVVDNGVYL